MRWKRGSRPAAVLLVLGASLTATATPAAAAPLPAPSGFTVKASNGYSIFVFGARGRGKDEPDQVGIFVTGKTGSAAYSTPATLTETTIKADLGSLGKIDVSFQPSGQARKVQPLCIDPVSFDSGHYEGTIVFHGEEDYTDLEATRAPGDIGFLLDVICPGSGGAIGPGLPGAQLEVRSGPRQSDAHMTVIKNRPRGPAHYEVSVSEEYEGVAILRFANPVLPARSFKYDPRIQTAMVRPPAPFSGTAQFHRKAKPANRWTGNLTVDLPGRSDVPLTGGNLRAGLAHAHWDWE
jgi:hypothetical protein